MLRLDCLFEGIITNHLLNLLKVEREKFHELGSPIHAGQEC